MIAVPLQKGILAGHRVADGSEAWQVEMAAEQEIATDGVRYYVAGRESVHALDARTGAVMWRAAVPTPTAPPLVRTGWLIVPARGALIALRAADGTEVWRQDPGPIEVRPAIDGDVLYVSAVDGRVLALDLPTGAQRWVCRLDGQAGEPLAVGGRVYLGAADKRFYSLDATTGRISWLMRTGAAPRGRPAADDRHVYFVGMDNLLRAVDRGHGALRWKKGLGFRPAAGPIIVGSAVIVPGPAATMPAFSARDGRPTGSVDFSGKLAALPVTVTLPDEITGLAVVTGSLEDQWKLSLLEPAFELPAIPVAPLTEVPGSVVPLGWPEPPASRSLPELQPPAG